MNTREIANEYRMSQWTQRITEQKASGQSIHKWCETNGIKRNQFFYWQKKLREAVCQELIPTALVKREEGSVPEGWAICAAEASEAESKALAIKIGNYQVMADKSVDEELLAKVCRVLSSIC